MTDTIFATASARGKAGVAVVRISGPMARRAGEALAGVLPEPRKAALRTLRKPGGEEIDRVLALRFEEGASFTGEETVELHVHGGAAVVAAVLGSLSEIDGLRLAEPGEFTRRALEGGRLSLDQVEGLADLIESETEAQRAQAMRVFQGALGRKVEKWRGLLVKAASLTELTIDFSDEDVPSDTFGEVLALVDEACGELAAELKGSEAAERVREGFEVAIVGPPNAGKSTLLNRLAGRDAALTSATAGTTRDVIEVRMDIRGLAVTFLDTAGIREALDDVEAAGIERAKLRARAADLRVFLDDGSGRFGDVEERDHDIRARGKADLGASGEGLAVSGMTGEGVDRLVDAVHGALEGWASGAGAAVRERHREAIRDSLSCLERARGLLEGGTPVAEIVAHEIRAGIQRLESLIGRVGVESLLDEIFASFCLGK